MLKNAHPASPIPFARMLTHAVWKNLQVVVKLKRHQGVTERHYHPDFYELVFVRRGSAINLFDDGGIPIAAGDFFLILPNVWHNYVSSRDLEIYNIIFSNSMLEYFKYDLSGMAIYHMMFQPPKNECRMHNVIHLDDNMFPEAMQLLEEIVQEQQSSRDGSKTVVLSNFLRIVTMLCRHGNIVDGSTLASQAYRVSMVLASLNAAPDKPWNLNKMARLACMAVSGFRKKFSEITGTTPVAYLLNIRLQNALNYLMLRKYSVGEVSAKCGFSDSNYFTRQFRKKYGVCPRQFWNENVFPGEISNWGESDSLSE